MNGPYTVARRNGRPLGLRPSVHPDARYAEAPGVRIVVAPQKAGLKTNLQVRRNHRAFHRRDMDVEEREGSLGLAREAADPSKRRVIVRAVLSGAPKSVSERAADAGRPEHRPQDDTVASARTCWRAGSYKHVSRVPQLTDRPGHGFPVSRAR